MRRAALVLAALVAASPVLAAGAYVTRNVNDPSGAHTQSYWDESGVGTGPFDPVYQMPNGYTGGGGSGSVSNTGFAAYGPDAIGATPTHPPVVNGYADANGHVQQVAPATPLPVTEGASNLSTNQTSATTTATQLCAARSGRRAVTLENITGTAPVFVGPSGVTTATGGLLPAVVGASLTVNTAAAVYGLVSATTQTVACIETY